MDNEMKGALFHNDKGDNPSRPDMRGEVTINGTKYSLSGWNNTSKGGKDYVGLKVSEWVDKPAQQPKPAQGGLDDQIPF
jgi:uncharacterized protein (DUF736 family)|tara:strand:- start:1899 stop:2135 length:237 start_codon:yes stop_codon:yes gene_type:complete